MMFNANHINSDAMLNMTHLYCMIPILKLVCYGWSGDRQRVCAATRTSIEYFLLLLNFFLFFPAHRQVRRV